MLACADITAAVLASLSLGFVFKNDVSALFWSIVFAPAWIVIAKLLGLYDLDQRSIRHLTSDEIPSLVLWAIAGTFGLRLFLSLTPAEPLELTRAVRVALVAVFFGLGLRAVTRYVWRRITPPEKVVILGNGAKAAAIRRKIELFPDLHMRIAAEYGDLSTEELFSELERQGALNRIIIASQSVDEMLVRDLVAFGRREHVRLSIVPPSRGLFGTAVQLNHIADLPVIEYNTWDISRSTLALKRVIDVLGACLGLIAFAPVAVLIALTIVIDSGWPVFFHQERAGLNGTMFRMTKFRTMVSDAEQRLSEIVHFDELSQPMFKLHNDPRITRVGRLLRRWSLDELPQLFSVLVGDMSLVGPRPEQVELVERYSEEQRFRLAVKPGLTGPMQVYGRGALSFEERLAVEREYVENLSLSRDARILAMTVPASIKGRGAF
jgi:exopolysaccharide biosynthesis polyprenyl glycosylphosphotransferase